jgi:hypothetical protein
MCSSSGVRVGGDQDWFADLVDSIEQTSPAAAYLYRSEERANPSASSTTIAAIEDVLGGVDTFRTHLDVELRNIPRAMGEDFLSQSDIRAVTDRTYEPQLGSALECVGFLDTSLTSDLTSLFLFGWDPASSVSPWQMIGCLHHRVWDPRRQGAPMSLDPVWTYLDLTLPNFPNLRALLVDDRGNIGWPKELVFRAQRDRARVWGSVVRGVQGKSGERKSAPGLSGGNRLDRDLGWSLFEARVKSRSILLPPLPEIPREIAGVERKQRLDGSWEIRDRARKTRHVDLVEAIAGCCLAAWLVAARPKGLSLSDPAYTQITSRLSGILSGATKPRFDAKKF